jgi:cobalt-zinc-cadmium efflux system outer membrane protein
MSIRTIAALLLVYGASASPAAAQDEPSVPPAAQAFIDPVSGLSLDQAIARGLAREPSLLAQRTSIETARGMRQQAGLRPNPAVSVEHREEPAGTDNQTMVTVAWPLDLFRRDGRIAVADREIAVAESAVADRERLLAAEVRARYGDAVLAVRELTVLEELVSTVRRQQELLRARVEQGASPPLERDLLEVELRRLDADRWLQVGRTESSLFELGRVLGASPDESLRLRDTLEDIVNRQLASSGGPLEGDPMAQRADVREAQARIGLAEAKVDRAERDGRFDVSLVGGYTRMDSGFPQFGLSAAGTPERVRGLFEYVTIGAMVAVPLFNRSQGDVAAARAGRAGAAASLEAVRLSAQTEVASARVRDRRAHEAVKQYGAGGARMLARQNLAVVGQSYELGRTTVFDVIAEQRRYLELERAYTETLRAAYEARTALKRALGEVQ